jgi:GAF domain-containing protein/HAMP domain-containing protein
MSTPVVPNLSEPQLSPSLPENTKQARSSVGLFKRRLNLDIKLPLMVILLLSLAFLVYTFLSVKAIQTALIDTLKSELAAQTASKAEVLRTSLIWTRGVAIDLAAGAEIVEYDEDTILKVIYNTLMHNDQIFGSTIAYEPYKFQPELYYWSPYYSRLSDTELQFSQLGNPDYDYFKWSWYTLPKEKRRAVLSLPYFDLGGGNIWMVTWSAPFYDQAGNVKGVATADIAFSQIQDIINKIPVGQKGYAFLLDTQGTILGIGENAGGYYEIMSDSMLTATYSAKAKGWTNLVDAMLAGDTGFAEAVDPQGKPVFVAYTPVGLDTGWSLALAFPQDELFQKASSPQNTLVLYAGLTVVVFGAILYLLTQSITQPLRRLTQHANHLSAEKLHLVGGKLAESIQINTRDELEDLAEAFNQMSGDLAQAFDNLEEKVADRARHLERRSLELETIAEVAREINIIHDLNTLLNVAANLIRERFKYYHVGIFLVDERGEFAVLRAASSVAAHQMLEQNYRLKVGQEGLVGNVTRTGKAHIALDVGTDAIHFQNPFLPNTHSEIALPLRNRSMTIGALDIQTDIQSAFSDQDVRVLQLLADQLAAAIENAQLVQKVEGTFAELNNAYRLQTQNVWRSAISQYKRPSYEYDGIQVRAVPPHLSNDLLKQLEGGEPIIIEETDELKDGHTKTTLMVPLIVLNQVIGVIGLEQEDPDHIWTIEEISIAQAAANRAGITLENARLLEESQRRALKERTIFDATARIGSAVNIENILKTTAEELERVLSGSEVILQFQTDHDHNPEK